MSARATKMVDVVLSSWRGLADAARREEEAALDAWRRNAVAAVADALALTSEERAEVVVYANGAALMVCVGREVVASVAGTSDEHGHRVTFAEGWRCRCPLGSDTRTAVAVADSAPLRWPA